MRAARRIVGLLGFCALTVVGCGRQTELPHGPVRPSTVIRTADLAVLTPRLVLAGTTPYVFYHDSTTGTVSVAWPHDNVWAHERIDGGDGVVRGAGLSAGCMCDPTGERPLFHLSYRDTTNADLIYASGKPGSWTVENLKPGGEAVAASTALTVNDKGHPWVFYTNDSSGSIGLFFRDADRAWQQETVDVPQEDVGNGGLGGRLSAAFDLRGNAYVAYQDLGKRALKVAERSEDGQWHAATVDGADGKGNFGGWLSLQAAPAHSFDLFQSFPRVAYWDGDNAKLRYAFRATDGSGWKTEFADDAGFVGSDVSLVVLPDGTSVATYLDEDRLDLKVAVRRGNVWTSWTEDDRGATGEYTSAAVDPNGDVHVAYFNRSDRAIRYRRIRLRE